MRPMAKEAHIKTDKKNRWRLGCLEVKIFLGYYSKYGPFELHKDLAEAAKKGPAVCEPFRKPCPAFCYTSFSGVPKHFVVMRWLALA
jgi:hypothetical protein